MNDIKNLNQLIRKYKKNIKTAEDLLNTHPSTILNVLHKEYSEALSDLKQLKESLKNGEGMETLADIEHRRWAKWQSYLHSLCIKNEDGSLTIPKERVDLWNKEIETPYCNLEEKLKEYDRAEVRNTLKEIIGK